VDPFVAIMLGIVGGLLVALILLGLYHPRSGNDALQWRPTRSPEVEVQNEIDDLDQMLEAANRRRRARGAPELTEESLRASVGQEGAEASRRREDYLADLDAVQMLEAKNTRRRAKGLPELTLDEYRASLGLPE
jgi:hypothetical protein